MYKHLYNRHVSFEEAIAIARRLQGDCVWGSLTHKGQAFTGVYQVDLDKGTVTASYSWNGGDGHISVISLNSGSYIVQVSFSSDIQLSSDAIGSTDDPSNMLF